MVGPFVTTNVSNWSLYVIQISPCLSGVLVSHPGHHITFVHVSWVSQTLFVLVTSAVLGKTHWSEICRISAGIAWCFPPIRLGFCVLWGGDGVPSPPHCRGGAPRTTHHCWCWPAHLVEACWSLLCISCGLCSLEGIPTCSPHSGGEELHPTSHKAGGLHSVFDVLKRRELSFLHHF